MRAASPLACARRCWQSRGGASCRPRCAAAPCETPLPPALPLTHLTLSPHARPPPAPSPPRHCAPPPAFRPILCARLPADQALHCRAGGPGQGGGDADHQGGHARDGREGALCGRAGEARGRGGQAAGHQRDAQGGARNAAGAAAKVKCPRTNSSICNGSCQCASAPVPSGCGEGCAAPPAPPSLASRPPPPRHGGSSRS